MRYDYQQFQHPDPRHQGPGPLAGMLSLAFLFAIGGALALLCRLALVLSGAL